MKTNNIFVSELSAETHVFRNYHFCRGNSSKRKTRVGIILKGRGTYIYMNRRLAVSEGDAVFIPENIYCYSEWRGDPEIEVMYVSGFIHCDGIGYEPQTVYCGEDVKKDLFRISGLLAGDYLDVLEAYALFYRVLQKILPQMEQMTAALDPVLQTAIAYITDHWNCDFRMEDVARECCVSESKLYHLFQKELGQTPVGLLNSIKINVAIEYLENENYSISTVSSKAGFRSENHFRKVFTALTGTTPLKYKKQIPKQKRPEAGTTHA